MQETYHIELIDGLIEMTDDEIEELIGGGRSITVCTMTRECAGNTWQEMFTCC